MIEWYIDIQIIKPFTSLEVPLRIEAETQYDDSYFHQGNLYHNKKTIIILYTYSGQGQFGNAKNTYNLTPGSCLLCNPGDPEIFYNYPPALKEPWKFIWFGFTGGPAHQKTKEMLLNFGPLYQLGNQAEIINKLESFQHYKNTILQMPPFDGAGLVHSVLKALANSKNITSEANTNNILVTKIQNLLSDPLYNHYCVNDLAQLLSLSREHISRVFKEYTGKPLQQYIIQNKIRKASELLKNTNLSIKEISIKLGFRDQHNFTRLFKKHTQMTPRKFKQSELGIFL